MTTKPNASLPNFRVIREAIIAAPPVPPGFPLDALHDAGVLRSLQDAPHIQPFLLEMRLEAARAQHTPLEPLSFSLFQLFETSGDRAAFERIYFDRRRRLAGLVLAAVVDETDEYLPALNDLIWEICGEYTWCLPAHLPVGVEQVQMSRVPPEQVVDLFSAHTAHMLAEVLALLDGRLPGWMHYRVRSEVERRVFRPVFYDPHHFWWESAAMNWAAVCGGCTGMAALILEPDRERLAGMIDRVIRTMESFLDSFGADSGCPEGIGYWVYGFGFFTYFADMLARFTGGQLDLFQSERVRQIARFPQVVSLSNGQYVSFSDVSTRTVIHPGLGSRLAQLYQPPIPALKLPDFHADHCYRWGHVTRDLIWTDASALDQPVSEGTFYLDDLAWVVDRRSADGCTLAFAAKGGHNDEPHNHNDLGHFIVHAGGENLLVDLGAGVYTRQYFREQRYEFLHTGSQGHSVPVINGRTQAAGSQHRAVPLRYDKRSDGAAFTLELTRAYEDPTLQSFVRSFDWSVDLPACAAVLRLTDTFEFHAPGGNIVECFISFVPPVIEENMVVWQGARSRLIMQFDPAVFAASIQTLEVQMHHGDGAAVHQLRLNGRKAQPTQVSDLLFRCEVSPPAGDTSAM